MSECPSRRQMMGAVLERGNEMLVMELMVSMGES
jgi:hypothetical protein